LRSPSRRAVSLIVAVLTMGSLLTAPASAAVVTPSLELIAPADSVQLTKTKGAPVWLDLGVMLASRNAPFELHVARPDYSQPQVITQVLYGEGDEREEIMLPTGILNEWSGLKNFFEITVTNQKGNTVLATSTDFCPNGYPRERVSDDGPQLASFAEGCWANPFTKGVAWGIDAEWAVGISGFEPPVVALPKGDFNATVSIADEYIDLFDIDPAAATAAVEISIEAVTDGCYDFCSPGGHHPATPARSSAVPVVEDPDPATLPDLAALPAWGIGLDQRRKKTFLTFGATVWNGGASELVVEGFRRPGEDVMDGWQYFYENGAPTGKQQVGELEYDERDGHHHWHFLQFAQYSLYDESQSELIRSKKEAFCLAPTDAIDLLIPNASWNPGEIGLHTACGTPNSIWVREILPLGWGDTYFQGLPGQSFNITDVPNGTYYIAVIANPSGLLHEQTDANNMELREIVLGGTKENRTVEVPPWNGIDTG
jgi:hypothetical protein